MKRVFFVIAVLLSLSLNAQKTDNALLWKISGNGLTQPSYLFGTVHITCNATLDANILAALDATTQLYLELDLDDPSLQTQMMKGAWMKDGKTLASLTTPEDFKILDEFLTSKIKMSAKMMNRLKPTFVSMMVMPKILPCTPQSYEEQLMAVTKSQKEEVYGLESVADQIAALNAEPYETQMEALVKMAKNNMAEETEQYAKMMVLYNNKDLNGIMEFMKEDGKSLESNTALLDDRNKAWIPKIEEIAKATPTFFGVGAAHLGGDNGVINLLRKKGYKVEAIK
jgi:uncharacterized protein YbaP (TraB family)